MAKKKNTAIEEHIAALEAELAEAQADRNRLAKELLIGEEPFKAERDSLKARNAKLEEALKWYVATSPYSKYGMSGLGEKARQALEPSEGEKP